MAKNSISIADFPSRLKALRPSDRPDMVVGPEDVLAYILAKLWSHLLHPVLDALAITVSFDISKILHLFCLIETNYTYFRCLSYMVVPYRSTGIPPYPCSRRLLPTFWTKVVRLCSLIIHTKPYCTSSQNSSPKEHAEAASYHLSSN